MKVYVVVEYMYEGVIIDSIWWTKDLANASLSRKGKDKEAFGIEEHEVIHDAVAEADLDL